MRPPGSAAQEDAFLADVAANPEEDAPRLVYADWLEDRDPQDPRAEFIRLQFALADMPQDAPGRAGLQDRETVLLEQEAVRWRTQMAIHGVPVEHLLGFERGFPEYADMEMANFPAFAGRLFGLVPVTKMKIWRLANGAATHVRGLFDCAHLSRLRYLNLDGNRLGDDEAGALAACPHLAGLRELRLENNRLSETAAAVLGAARNLAGLECLSVSQNWLGSAGAEAFAASSDMLRLRRLDLSWNRIGPDGVEALAGSRLGAGAVNLGRNPLGDEGARLLAASPWGRRLESLEVAESEIGEAGAIALARSPHLTRLRLLDVTWNRIGPAGVRALTASAVGRIVGLGWQGARGA